MRNMRVLLKVHTISYWGEVLCKRVLFGLWSDFSKLPTGAWIRAALVHLTGEPEVKVLFKLEIENSTEAEKNWMTEILLWNYLFSRDIFSSLSYLHLQACIEMAAQYSTPA